MTTRDIVVAGALPQPWTDAVGAPLALGVSDIEPTTEALAKALHDERVASGTQDVDCWACEAAKSPAIAALLKSLRKARAHGEHVEMVLDRAVPDDEEQMELWRAHWREQILRRRTKSETKP